MEYQNYIINKRYYLHLNNQTGGKKKKCTIDDTDKILFGDGGSTAIIVITKDKRVYKIYTIYFYSLDLKNSDMIKKENKKVKNEIGICEQLTKNIINKNISSHIVKYIGANDCKNAKKLFADCPKSYNEFLKIADDQKSKLCKTYFRNYPDSKIDDKYKVIEIEYCDYSCVDFIKDVSKLPEIEMEKYLDIFFFQIIHTIVMIQSIYPYFIHMDLFMRNILGLREKDNGNYYEYEYNKKTYYVPQKKFFPKINDFGQTNLNNEYKTFKLIKSEYKDIYNILYDVYDGNGLGGTSLTELCKDNPDKIKFLKIYFSNYFDVEIIDENKSKSKQNMDWDWSNILDDDYVKHIKMKKPKDLLDGYFYDIFKKINKNVNKNVNI